MKMNWREIEPELRRRAAEVIGYAVSEGHVVNGWAWINEMGHSCWGWPDEQAAWDAAFRDICRRWVIYRHKKGGIYQSRFGARATWGDCEPMMVYHHLAPHEPGAWVRPLAEFEEPGRFVRVEA